MENTEFDKYEQIEEIMKVINQYTLGNFQAKSSRALQNDFMNELVDGVNKLGDKLQNTTISRDYFNSIFNSITDLLFVVTADGKIRNANRIAKKRLSITSDNMGFINFDELMLRNSKFTFSEAKKVVDENKTYEEEGILRRMNGERIFVHGSMNSLTATHEKLSYLIVLRDISHLKKTENFILRTIIETEERERARLARDLHDSLGQELSGIQYYLEAIKQHGCDSKSEALLQKSIDSLKTMSSEVRNVCFDLMPGTLEQHGLIAAARELSSKIEIENLHISLKYSPESENIQLPVELEKGLYRVIQELFNNTVKHSKANHVSLEFMLLKDEFAIVFEDDGVGFDFSKKMMTSGMGLKNIQSRIKSYNGEIKVFSKIGKGTQYSILVSTSI